MRTPSTTTSDFDSCRPATVWPVASSLAALCISLFVLAFAAAPASAARPYQSQLTEANGSALSNPFGLSVDGSDNLWVSDTGSSRVSRFNSAGVYQTQNTGTGSWAGSSYIESLAFSEAAGKVFVSDSNFDDLWGLNAADATYSGTDLNSGLGGGCCFIRVAADNSAGAAAGDLYVSTGSSVVRITGAGAADNFSASQPYISGNALTGPFSSPGALAVGPTGNLYVASGNKVYVFDPSGVLLEEFTEFEGSPLDSITAIAADPSNENVLLAEAGAIDEFNADGESLAKISEANGTGFGGIRGLAVDSAGTLYVADGSKHVIDVFGAAPASGGVKFPLEVSLSGSGAGKVTSSPSGISCSSGSCTSEFREGKLVTLTATPAAHSKFVAWTGCESEPGPSKCAVTMSAARAVEAEFAAIPPQTLQVAVSGPGEVTSSPAGISCTAASSPCSKGFDSEGPESTVTLTAQPDAHNHFVKWAGSDVGSCASPTAPTCQVTMSQARSLSAEFAPNLHTVTVVPTGSGSVSATTGAISGCEEGGGTCSGQYQEASTVTLTAAPAVHNHVTWHGCTAVPSANTCELTIFTSDSTVEAEFAVNIHTLTITPAGLGSVSANEGAISACSAAAGTCAGVYDEASSVTLTATPAAHKHVVWGTGDCDAESGPGNEECEVEIGPSDSIVEVAYPPNTHLLTVTPSGAGAVRAESGAISHCSTTGGSCAGQYIEAGIVTLTASPDAQQKVAWRGCTTVPSPNTCKVLIGDADAGVGASFVQNTHTLTIAKAGTGQGSVSCDGGACAYSYPEGTNLTLTGAAAPGSTFAGWSGAGCSGSGVCQVTIDADTALTATFDAKSGPSFTGESCVVPELAGKTLRQAKIALSSAHCSLGKVVKPKRKQGDKLAGLLVRSSSPAAGTTLPTGAEVDLRLGAKSKKVRK
jgi:Divergent InlB B-repeat domain/PASTA domain